ncbi:MAG: hypothetical protein E7Y34_02925, partial [Mycoplasma sp.]|nr:hypothetical protein [Mycoplasma sp.]
MRAWGEDFDALPAHVTKGYVRTGDFVMAEKTIRPGQGMGKPLVERWDGKEYDQGFAGKEEKNGIIMGVVQYSPIVPGWDTKDEKKSQIMTDVDIAISDKFIYVVCHGVVRSGALVQASSIEIKDANGNKYSEHGVIEATADNLVIGRAVSF